MKLLSIIFFLLTSSFLKAQEPESFILDGNFRYALIGNGTGENGLDNAYSALRSRVGFRYTLDEIHSFRVRLAATFSNDIETASFTIKSDGSGLAFGNISFDEFYYRFQNKDFDLKIGRFQHSIGVRSNAGRSLMRFQSNSVSIHWSDGIYVKRTLETDWYVEFIGEYQPKNHVTYPYQGNLDFNNSDHNFTTYLGIENRVRDSNNIIQKGFGLFLAPKAYRKTDGYSTYAAITSRIAIDLPKQDLLSGGSFRIAGELGQNFSTSLKSGTMAIISVGVNRVADRHEFMVEFAKTDSQWLLANVYARNGDEVELRYRFFAFENLNFDARYRIRTSRNSAQPYEYSTFLRTTYSF